MTDLDKILRAVAIAFEDGQVDGSHHKMWVIDQMVRVLTGDNYEALVKLHCLGEDGDNTYDWDCGIAP
jgi:hypothetical protein